MVVFIILLSLIVITVVFFKVLKKSSLSFWKIVGRHPDQALVFFRSKSYWKVIDISTPPSTATSVSSKEWDGPFRISIADERFANYRIYGKIGEYEPSEKEFVKNIGAVGNTVEKERAYTTKELCKYAALGLVNCLFKEGGFTDIIKKYCSRETAVNFEDKDINILTNAINCFVFAAAIITIRNKYSEKAETFVRHIHALIKDIYSEQFDDNKKGEFAVSLVKNYSANWVFQTSKSANSIDFAFRISEMFLEPISESLSCSNILVKSIHLPTVLLSIVGAVGKTTNEVLKKAKSEFNYEPSFRD